MTHCYTACRTTQDRSFIVLTKTQIRSAKTKELEKLQRRIEAELERRREEAQRQSHTQDETAQRFSAGHKGSYQWEFRECGHANRCLKCKGGRKHGPYLYRYFYKNGKQKSEYIRKS